MTLSLGTTSPSTQDAVTAVAALGTVAAVRCWAHSWLQHCCRPGHPVPTAPRSRGSAGSHCCPPSVFGCKPSLQAKSWAQPHHTFPRRMCMTSSSVQAAVWRARTEGRAKVGLPQKRPFEGSLLPPFQAGSFHYLSPHPAPRDLWFRDTHSHLLLRQPQGQEAGHHPGEQTDIEKRTGEGKVESVGRQKTPSEEDWCSGQELPLEVLEGKQERSAGQKNGQRVTSSQSLRVLQKSRGSWVLAQASCLQGRAVNHTVPWHPDHPGARWSIS